MTSRIMHIASRNLNIYYDFDRRKLYNNGEWIDLSLSSNAHNLLEILANNYPNIMKYDAILDRLQIENSCYKTITSLVCKINKAFKPYNGEDDILKNTRSTGYCCSFKLEETVVDTTDNNVVSICQTDSTNAEAEHKDHKEDILSVNTESFYDYVFKNMEQIDSVQLAFHGGHLWTIQGTDQNRILKKLELNPEIDIQVLINRIDVAESISQHMRDQHAYQNNEYTNFPENKQKWMNISRDYPHIQVRECPLTIIHSYFCFHMKKADDSIMHLSFYAYDNPATELNFRICLSPADPSFKIYRKEFDYLWSKSD